MATKNLPSVSAAALVAVGSNGYGRFAAADSTR